MYATYESLSYLGSHVSEHREFAGFFRVKVPLGRFRCRVVYQFYNKTRGENPVEMHRPIGETMPQKEPTLIYFLIEKKDNSEALGAYVLDAEL